ncbi:hypothetical protein LJR230_003656 [Trinickia sp. LjRoot230]|uniref:hypothetical protein n=1 Tax=Trinickia sp. LjRoot230 TaxID=3342288 RepID=UPI003ECCCC3B
MNYVIAISGSSDLRVLFRISCSDFKKSRILKSASKLHQSQRRDCDEAAVAMVPALKVRDLRRQT